GGPTRGTWRASVGVLALAPPGSPLLQPSMLQVGPDSLDNRKRLQYIDFLLGKLGKSRRERQANQLSREPGAAVLVPQALPGAGYENIRLSPTNGGRCERRRRSDVLRIGSARDEEDLRFYLPHLDRKAPKSEVATTLSLTGWRGPGRPRPHRRLFRTSSAKRCRHQEPLPDMDTTPAVDCDGLLDRGSGRTVITMSGTPLVEESSSSTTVGSSPLDAAGRLRRFCKRLRSRPSKPVSVLRRLNLRERSLPRN
ncbi:hypothetical protein MRX96_052378, partial [Rhipicephalus microplus]